MCRRWSCVAREGPTGGTGCTKLTSTDIRTVVCALVKQRRVSHCRGTDSNFMVKICRGVDGNFIILAPFSN